ncbi:hypothetical protein E3N88_43735 [Mikania micrantha]|uniref:Thioredoxin domain-containing protein n=1 Tax=Mikania micrantha TaxID=192012 RepID=A0A5N6LE21_9ASTR|nr:hypothetical protein E3N88_43735 [Mikania micrantha]
MGLCFSKVPADEDEPESHPQFAGGNVTLITTKNAWDQKLSEAKTQGKVVIANFSATWCGPCKSIASYYIELSEKYPSLMFLTIDVDELTDSIPDYSADLVVGHDVKGVACNVSFSRFCYSNGHGPVYNDGLLGVGQSQPNTYVNYCPSEKGYKSRGEGFQTNRYLKAGMSLLPKHGHANSSDRGANSLSQTEWEDRRMKGLFFWWGQQFELTLKCSPGRLHILLLGTDESDYEEGKHLLLEVDNSPN